MSKTKVEPKAEAPKLKHQPGDIIAFTTWAKVDKHNPLTLAGPTNIQCTHADGPMKGEGFGIHGQQLIDLCLSADRYHTEEKVNKTKAAEILVSSYNTPFTVVFDKDDGTERKLRGRLIHPEPLLGRSMVHDFDADGPRLVDHRTIKSLTVNGVKYTVK